MGAPSVWVVEAHYEDGEKLRHVGDDYRDMLDLAKRYRDDGLRLCRSDTDVKRLPVNVGIVHFWEM